MSLKSVLCHDVIIIIIIMSLLHHTCTGVPCEVTDVIYNGTGQSYIECITGPEPPQRNYYPGNYTRLIIIATLLLYMIDFYTAYFVPFLGGRGVFREVFIGGSININDIRQRPPSDFNSVIDKLFRSTEYSTPQFGEETFFTQRLTGFFVPPVSCLYTLNLRSDDLSRLYFSRNASSTVLPDTPLINVHEHTRRRSVAI